MKTIIPAQLRSYMALIYGLVKYEDFFNIDSKKDCTSFKQKFKWNDVKIKRVTEHLPGIKAPSSTVIFWKNYLNLSDNENIKTFDDYGYFSLNELLAELGGFYTFWESSRSVLFFKIYVKYT